MAASHSAAIAWADIVACQLETPLPVVRWALAEAKRHDVTTMLNPAPVQPLNEDILALVDFLTPNEHEAARLTGLAVDSLDSARAAAVRLLASGAGTVLITLGERGVLACYDDNAAHFPAFTVQAVGTTGSVAPRCSDQPTSAEWYVSQIFRRCAWILASLSSWPSRNAAWSSDGR